MDVPLEYAESGYSTRVVSVSILVLVDVPLESAVLTIESPQIPWVSILVLVDVPLEYAGAEVGSMNLVMFQSLF